MNYCFRVTIAGVHARLDCPVEEVRRTLNVFDRLLAETMTDDCAKAPEGVVVPHLCEIDIMRHFGFIAEEGKFLYSQLLFDVIVVAAIEPPRILGVELVQLRFDESGDFEV